MDKKLSEKIVVTTTTYYKSNSEDDKCRAELAKETIKKSKERGFEIIVIDGGSLEQLVKEFKELGAKVYPQKEKGMGKSRRQAIQEAYNTGKEIIAWIEPEKSIYVDEIIKTALPIINGQADIVVPKRKSLKSYPLLQQYSEKLGNLFWKRITGTDLDMWSGPRTWRRKFSKYFLNYKGVYGDKWDSIFIPVMDAILNGAKVMSVKVDYQHPKKQTEIEGKNFEFDKKRLEQLVTLVSAFEDHWKKNKKHNNL